MGQLQSTAINPGGELPAPTNIFAAMETLNKKDAFEMTEADKQIAATNGTQLIGHFLVDREGIVRWGQVEASERMNDLGKHPTDDEIVQAARSL